MRKIDTIVVHCSATQPKQDIDAAWIDRLHRSQGWRMCGYHYVIKRDGTIESQATGQKCRPVDQAGAHVGNTFTAPGQPGWNSRSIGICMAGGINEKGKAENNFTDVQFKSLEELVLTLIENNSEIKYIGGHRDVISVSSRYGKTAPKDCPCFEVKTWFDTVQDKQKDSLRVLEIVDIKDM